MNRSARLGLFVVGTVGFVCMMVGASIDVRPAWSIQAEPKRIELGKVEPNSQHQATFRVVNRGKERGRIIKIATTCGCTVVQSQGAELAETGTAEIAVDIKAGPWAGESVRYISLEIEGVNSNYRRVIRYPVYIAVTHDAPQQPPPKPEPECRTSA